MAENLENGEEKKSSKMMYIIIAVVILLAGGGAGYYFMSEGDTTTESEQEVVADVEEMEEEEVGDEVYFDLESALIVTFPKENAASLIQVSISLLVDGEDFLETMKKHEPMIRNSLIMAISSKSSDFLMKREGKDELRSEMLSEISKKMKKMTGKNRVKDIFFTTFVMQ